MIATTVSGATKDSHWGKSYFMCLSFREMCTELRHSCEDFRGADGASCPGGEDAPNQGRGGADRATPEESLPGNGERLGAAHGDPAHEGVGDPVDQAARDK